MYIYICIYIYILNTAGGFTQRSLQVDLWLHDLNLSKLFSCHRRSSQTSTSPELLRCDQPWILIASQIGRDPSPPQIAKGPFGRGGSSRLKISLNLFSIYKTIIDMLIAEPQFFFPASPISIHLLYWFISLDLWCSNPPNHLEFGPQSRPNVPSIHYEGITVLFYVAWKGPLRELGEWFPEGGIQVLQ